MKLGGPIEFLHRLTGKQDFSIRTEAEEAIKLAQMTMKR